MKINRYEKYVEGMKLETDVVYLNSVDPIVLTGKYQFYVNGYVELNGIALNQGRNDVELDDDAELLIYEKSGVSFQRIPAEPLDIPEPIEVPEIIDEQTEQEKYIYKMFLEYTRKMGITVDEVKSREVHDQLNIDESYDDLIDEYDMEMELDENGVLDVVQAEEVTQDVQVAENTQDIEQEENLEAQEVDNSTEIV